MNKAGKEAVPTKAESSSYGQILKSSSIMGGAAGFELLLGMVRVKFAAVLIGTMGVGLIASYNALQGVVGTIAGLGLRSSAVRDISLAVSRQDHETVARKVKTLKRLCWFTGLAGLLTMILLAPWLGQITFGHQEYTTDIAALGAVVLMMNLAGGQMAIIQGMRRISTLAKVNVCSAIFGTACAVVCYTFLGLRGIVPTLVAVAASQFLISWYFARNLHVNKVQLSWAATFTEGNQMVRLGMVLMVSSLMTTTVSFVTIALVTRQEGIDAAGIYSAAFALSGLFVGFVLNAMGADYYPRLTACVDNHVNMRRLVNEQTEIGLLLAAPGLLGTVAMAPWVIQLFYTDAFLGSVPLIHWFILGCFGKVVSWPLGFVMLALGKGRWYLFTEITANLLHVGLITIGLHFLGLQGVAIAMPLMYVSYTLLVFAVAWWLIGFKWNCSTFGLLLFLLVALATTIFVCKILPLPQATVAGLLICLSCSVYCLRGVLLRLGSSHRWVLQLRSRSISRIVLNTLLYKSL
ncbi:O-antigen translocase [uncultured Limnobacter sp.]|uniref:O-antigen translocase n=1 Tax=uncultured Limnobacter sp. TaxID=199681 RepID=UPI0030F57E77